MADFYARVDAEQRRKRGLYGVYLVTGERKDRGTVGGGEDTVVGRFN